MSTTNTKQVSTSSFKPFGIKEVADVAFYPVGSVKLGSDGTITVDKAAVLTFETLKVSNLEFTGETTEARGGKGNTIIMSWDHSREATLTLEDALLSVESLNAMLSGGKFEHTTFSADGQTGNREIISITANGFPGTYTVIGKTYARDTDGTDQFLTFLIWKAKVSSETSFEMTADGDPSTLNMTLKVLRADQDDAIGSKKGEMIKMIIETNTTGDNTPMITWPTATDDPEDEGEET